MIKISPFLIQAYLTCSREAWLEHHAILADQDHEVLTIGRLIHERSYARDRKETMVDGLLKIDIIRDELVAEVKKSSRHIEAARLQLLYYLFYLKREKGLLMKGVLLFPKEKRAEKIILTLDKEQKIEKLLREIQVVINADNPPPVQKNRFCRTCAFREFCWA